MTGAQDNAGPAALFGMKGDESSMMSDGDMFNNSMFNAPNKNKYGAGAGGGKGIFDESMNQGPPAMGGGNAMFDETVDNDMSMSMDADLNKNQLANIFGGGGLDESLRATKQNPKMLSNQYDFD